MLLVSAITQQTHYLYATSCFSLKVTNKQFFGRNICGGAALYFQISLNGGRAVWAIVVWSADRISDRLDSLTLTGCMDGTVDLNSESNRQLSFCLYFDLVVLQTYISSVLSSY